MRTSIIFYVYNEIQKILFVFFFFFEKFNKYIFLKKIPPRVKNHAGLDFDGPSGLKRPHFFRIFDIF